MGNNHLELLKEKLFYYYNATDIPLRLFNSSGDVLLSFCGDMKYCSMVKEACGSREFCGRIHKEGREQCVELSDGYVFSCPGGLIHFAVPVIKGGRAVCTILAGPLSVDYPDISVVDGVIQGYGLSINLRRKFFAAFRALPITEPVRIQHLSKLLFVLVNQEESGHDTIEDMIPEKGDNKKRTELSDFTELSVLVPILQKAVSYIDSHYSENLRLENVAAFIGLNPSYFSTIFKRELKISFSGYLIQKRIEEACSLLLNTNHSLSEIAASVGFENQSYFSQCFRRHTGMTPMQYRKQGRAGR